MYPEGDLIPPFTEMVTSPSATPEQVAFTRDTWVKVILLGLVKFSEACAKQPKLSLTVTLYALDDAVKSC